jgi:CheY-like chemotaxis protein
MSKINILLVEDVERVRIIISELLKINDYNIVSESDAESAIKRIESWIPDIIISDVMMPNCSGFEFFKNIRNNEQFSKIPFIFITGKSSDDELEKKYLFEANAFLIKPFKIEDLISLIHSHTKK